MRKKGYGIYVSILLVAVVLVCAVIYNNRPDRELDMSTGNKDNDKVNSNDLDSQINSILEDMTIEEKIGQMLIIDFKYKYLNDYEYTDKSLLGCAEHQSIINKVNFER